MSWIDIKYATPAQHKCGTDFLVIVKSGVNNVTYKHHILEWFDSFTGDEKERLESDTYFILPYNNSIPSEAVCWQPLPKMPDLE